MILRKAHYPALNYVLRNEQTGGVQFAHRNRLKVLEPLSSLPGFGLLPVPVDSGDVPPQDIGENREISIGNFADGIERDRNLEPNPALEDEDGVVLREEQPRGFGEVPTAGDLRNEDAPPLLVAPLEGASNEAHPDPHVVSRGEQAEKALCNRPPRSHRSPLRYADEFTGVNPGKELK